MLCGLLLFMLACATPVSMAQNDDNDQTEEVEPLKKKPFKWFFGDNTLEFGSRLRLESFYSRNTTLLNNANGGLDKTFVPVKYTMDFAGIYGFGCQSQGYDIVRIKAALRSRGNWGAPETIASTDDAFIKDVDVVEGRHSHTINRHMVWIREFWLEMVLNDAFDWNPHGRYIFTAGFFPFQLGRGISLGDSYATDPDLLGYYSPNVIDQYAPGLKISGKLSDTGCLNFDAYAAILHNKANTFNNVNMRIRGQQIGCRLTPARGFAVINWLIALQMQWHIMNEDEHHIVFAPYALYDDEREQKIEFVGDASSKLGTFGCALEGNLGCWEFGFDVARNVGRQNVRGWDRNVITKDVRTGIYYEVNSDVTAIADNPPTNDLAGKRAVFTPVNQAIVNSSPQDQAANGKQIGVSNLKNSNDRFNNPYSNKFKGLMFVGDIGYNFTEELKFAAAAGMATGDNNPNRDLDELNDSNIDGDYQGFIGLQETYSGTRVRSAFLLSGAGRVPRVLSFPSENVTDNFPESVSRFTNIIFTGAAAWIESGDWNVNTNVLTYWTEAPTRIFNQDANLFVTESFARSWLGVEMNLFADVTLCNTAKLFFVGAVFIPGSHYSDIKGRPLSKDQERFLESLDVTGNPAIRVPVLGTDAAYTINIGMEYKF